MSEQPKLNTLQEIATYELAAIFRHLPDPKIGGPRSQNITFLDTWYPSCKHLLNELRRAGDAGVLLHDWEVREGWHE